jgi:co-chaperonin GroES (HSP10)
MLDKGRLLPLKVLVREIKPPEKKGSIIIAVDVTRFPTISGEVVLLGALAGNLKDTQIDVGDKILFSPHVFVRVTIEDEEYLLLNLQDVLYIWK